MTKRFFAALCLTAVLSMSAAATAVSPAAASEKPTPPNTAYAKAAAQKRCRRRKPAMASGIMRERLLASTKAAENHIRMRSRSDWSFIRQSAKNAESARQR